LLSLSTIAGTEISNPSWVNFQSAGWVSFQSAPTNVLNHVIHVRDASASIAIAAGSSHRIILDESFEAVIFDAA
ncbi:hypothetical protein, partial [Pseudomonas viridiflava]